jgi:hypothetical protein
MHGNVRAKKSFEFSLNVNAVFPSHRKPTRQLQIWNYIYARLRTGGRGGGGGRGREGGRGEKREKKKKKGKKKGANTRYAYA